MAPYLALPYVLALLAAPGPDLSGLSSTQRRVFEQIASEEFCGCNSPLTLAGCLNLHPDCRIAVDLGNLIVRALAAGAGRDSLAGFLSQAVMGPFCATPTPLKLVGAPQKGKDTAPITVIEFADFRCSHCREAVPMVHQAVKSLGAKVRLVFVPFALQGHPLSVAAAEAALAAHAQGKFWDMHQALFGRDAGDFEPAVLSQLAKTAGLNMKQFEQDMASHRFQSQVQDFLQQGRAAKIAGTPTFFINGRRFAPEPGIWTLEQRLEFEMHRDVGKCS